MALPYTLAAANPQERGEMYMQRWEATTAQKSMPGATTGKAAREAGEATDQSGWHGWHGGRRDTRRSGLRTGGRSWRWDRHGAPRGSAA